MKTLNFVEWLDAECKKDPDNLCDPPLEPQLAVQFLCDYLLGEDWYVVMPESTKQVNTAIVYDILEKYSKRFRKEVKQYRRNQNAGRNY